MSITVIIGTRSHEPLYFRPIELMPGIVRIPGQPPPMPSRPHHPIPNHNSHQVNLILLQRHGILIDNLIGQEGNVHPTVTLARDPELIGSVLLEILEPLGDGFVGGQGRAVFGVLVVRVLVLGEAHAGWVLEE